MGSVDSSGAEAAARTLGSDIADDDAPPPGDSSGLRAAQGTTSLRYVYRTSSRPFAEPLLRPPFSPLSSSSSTKGEEELDVTTVVAVLAGDCSSAADDPFVASA